MFCSRLPFSTTIPLKSLSSLSRPGLRTTKKLFWNPCSMMVGPRERRNQLSSRNQLVVLVHPTYCFSDFKEYHTDTTVRFLVKIAGGKLRELRNEGLHKVFKLQTVINTTSMVSFVILSFHGQSGS